MDRHYHVWLYERGEDGTISILRRADGRFEKRWQANAELNLLVGRGSFSPVTQRSGQVLVCDGSFCEATDDVIDGFSIAGPSTIPVTNFIDRQTKSIRPNRKAALAAESLEAGEGKDFHRRAKGDTPWTRHHNS